MIGIRWIIGLPLGYGVYRFVMWLNYEMLYFLAPKLSFVSEVIWQLESLFVNGMLAVYIALSFTYIFLPTDEFAVYNNNKIRVIYWALCVWTILQLILLGAMVNDAIHNYYDGLIWQIVYVPIMISTTWFIYKAVALLDFKYNQPARDYLEQIRFQEEVAAAEFKDI